MQWVWERQCEKQYRWERERDLRKGRIQERN